MASDGSAKVLLVENATDPSISADRRLIAFLRYDNIEAYRPPTTIWVVNSDVVTRRVRLRC